jgi:hypothetical protein
MVLKPKIVSIWYHDNPSEVQSDILGIHERLGSCQRVLFPRGWLYYKIIQDKKGGIPPALAAIVIIRQGYLTLSVLARLYQRRAAH